MRTGRSLRDHTHFMNEEPRPERDKVPKSYSLVLEPEPEFTSEGCTNPSLQIFLPEREAATNSSGGEPMELRLSPQTQRIIHA